MCIIATLALSCGISPKKTTMTKYTEYSICPADECVARDCVTTILVHSFILSLVFTIHCVLLNATTAEYQVCTTH